MANFDEIRVDLIVLFTDSGLLVANGTVNFERGDGGGPAISVKVSAVVEPTETVEKLPSILAMKAIRLLREAAAVPDATVDERLRLGSRSYDDRVLPIE